MTNMAKFGGHGFIKLENVRGKPFRDRIAAVTESEYERPILHFESGRRFSLNVTNTDAMLDAYGVDDNAWIGQVVELSPGMLPRNGGEQEGVCLMPISRPEHYGDGVQRKQPIASSAKPEPDEFGPGPTAKPTRRIETKHAVPSPDFDDEIPN